MGKDKWLSEENINKLKELINDENFDLIYPKIKQFTLLLELIGDKFKKFFKLKGLSNKDFDNNPNLGHRISDIFAKYNNTQSLKNIVNTNGIISLNELLNTKSVNLIDICKTYNMDENCIKEIANINDVSSNHVNVGKYEILLKLILKENSVKSNKGDISILYNDYPIDIEIKAGLNLNKSGAVCGLGVRSIQDTSNYFKSLYNKQSDVILFGGKKNGPDEKLIQYLGKGFDVNLFIKNLCESLYYQYNIFDKGNLNYIIHNVIQYNDKYNVITPNYIKQNEFIQLFGILQTHCYCVKDKWNYICVIDTTHSICSIHNGSLDCSIDWIENMSNKFIYMSPESNENADGRRAISRIFVK